MQEEVDDLTQALTPTFGAASQMRGYHPDAKRLAYAQLFRRYGLRFERDAMLFLVQRVDDTVTSSLLATEQGTIEIAADFWIDGTGDGDVCAMAGASFRFGRDSDGVSSPYTQSAVQLVRTKTRWYLGELNFDSGWVDPRDPGDMTRARLVGLDQLCELSTQPGTDVLVAIAPMVGLRQSRQIETRHTLDLDDLVRHRNFDDAVTHVGAHFDNHMLDYQLESKEAMFWVWCAHQWRTPVASDLPLRALRPKDLDNVLLACRALGVSRDAHHAVRMMRDMQRIGEAVGTIAAADKGRRNPDVALAAARQSLLDSGALFSDRDNLTKQTRYGPDAISHFSSRPEHSYEDAVADLGAGLHSVSLWTLFSDWERSQDDVRRFLVSNDAVASWLAACIAGLHGDNAAEPRLIEAILNREEGESENTAKYCTDAAFNPFPPNWVVAVAVLRECGTARSADVLYDLLDNAEFGLDVRVTIVQALKRLAEGSVPLDVDRLRRVADQALVAEMPGLLARPQQAVLRTGDVLAAGPQSQSHNMRWKLILAFAELMAAIEVDDPRFIDVLREDPRATVRNSYRPEHRQSAPMETL